MTKEKVITIDDGQFRKIKPTRTLYTAKIIGSSEPEYFLDYKITTVRYLPTDEHYDIVREMFEICDNDPDNVVNWYNEKLVKILEHDLKILDENNADKDSIRYERIQKCRDDTLHFLVKRGRVIPQNILTEKQPEKESGGKSIKSSNNGGRPKDPEVAKKRGELNKRYYHLTEKEGLKKSHAIKKLVQEFPWKKTTIEKYIK
jgi:hypothetical protein